MTTVNNAIKSTLHTHTSDIHILVIKRLNVKHQGEITRHFYLLINDIIVAGQVTDMLLNAKHQGEKTRHFHLLINDIIVASQVIDIC